MPTQEEKPSPRRALPVIVATSALTLAIGVTVAALGGYLTPRRDAAAITDPPVPARELQRLSEEAMADAPRDAPSEAVSGAADTTTEPTPRTVLVPVVEDAPLPPPPREGIVAEAQGREREVAHADFERRGREHRREGKDDGEDGEEDDHDDD
ncbi:MAG: hypothetical protein U0414_16875 [Polyangiaceae bacterium]